MKKRYIVFPTVLLLSAAGLLFAEGAERKLDRLVFNDYAGHIYRASSSLESEGVYTPGPYGMHLLFDGDTYTGWSEGVEGSGLGELLWLKVDHGADTLVLRNGFARTKTLFKKNNRVQSVEVSLWSAILPAGMVTEVGPLYVITPETEGYTLCFEDSIELQKYPLPFDWSALKEGGSISPEEFVDFAKAQGLPEAEEGRALLLRIEITDVYRGSAWNDTCLTELRVFSDSGFTATEVYSDTYGVEGALSYDSPEGRQRSLYRDRNYLYDPYLVSSDGRWCVAFQTPAEVGERFETEYVLFRLPYPEVHNNQDFARSRREGLVPVDFEETARGVFLLFDDGSRIKLE